MAEALSGPEVRELLEALERLYPNPRTALVHRNPFELLVATMLSAQSTDEMVNRITPALFARCPTPEAFLDLTVEELESMIRTIGLFRTKARNILATCRRLVEDHGGQVPRSREALMSLPGVGRKTANVVLSNAFGQPAIAVDTHVFRVARRIGLASGKTPHQVEEQLMARLPEERWTDAHHWLILHGRRICHARRPRCEDCPIRHLCRTGRRYADSLPPAGDGSTSASSRRTS
ncbi:MAG TPA: endonuclease III [Bacillota bacterium]